MKTIKVIFILGLLILVGGLFMGFNQKFHINTETTTSKINLSKENFSGSEVELVNFLSNMVEEVPERKKGRFWRILGADLKGGLAGAGVASTVPGLGTGVGAIIGGVGASATEAGKDKISPSDNNTSNPNNPYDDAGKHHNAFLRQYYPDINCKANCDIFIYNLSENYIAKNFDISATTLSSSVMKKETIRIINAIKSNNIETLANQLVEEKKITPLQVIITDLYYENVLTLRGEQFYLASLKFEKTVLNSSIKESDKEIILSALSVGRHSHGFWVGESVEEYEKK